MKFRGFVLAMVFAGSVVAQSAPTFESAEIGVSRDAEPRSGYETTPRSLSIHNKSLKDCIRLAYDVKVAQLSGGPKWVETERYNIEARSKTPANDSQLMAMLQTLLKERFHLDIRRETRMVPGYAITMLKTGMKVREVEPGPGHIEVRRTSMIAQRTSMAKFAESLSEVLGSPVIDASAAPGVYDFRLEWTPDTDRPGLSAEDPEPSALPNMPVGPHLFAALQEQLGLRLEGRKAALDVLVIDRAVKPMGAKPTGE